jgi:ABC-type multidrug transport system ATPase subunit
VSGASRAGPVAPVDGVAGLDFDRVSVDDVSRHFGRRRAVSRISFQAHAGEIVGLLGPNGAGKSTMLAMLATLLRPSSGTITYGPPEGGPHIPNGPPEGGPHIGSGTHSGEGRRIAVSDPALRARIGVLGHDLFLYPELSARENLAFFAGLYNVARREAAADSALAHAGLLDRADDPVSSFSRGMRQRVALERALIHRPRLALLDEPFTGLDDASAAGLVERLRALKTQGVIVILATHDLELAEGLLDVAVFLRDGRMADSVARPEGLRSTYRAVMARPRS